MLPFLLVFVNVPCQLVQNTLRATQVGLYQRSKKATMMWTLFDETLCPAKTPVTSSPLGLMLTFIDLLTPPTTNDLHPSGGQKESNNKYSSNTVTGASVVVA